MLSLRAVVPHWLVILNANGVCKDICCAAKRSIGGHKAREECVGLVGHDIANRYTRVVKSGLNDRVVLFMN